MSAWSAAPGKPYRSLIHSTARFNLWHGPISSGKSIHSLIAWASWLASDAAPPSGLYFMVGKTLDTLERNLLKPADAGLPGFRYHKGRERAYYAGREIVCLSANDVKAEGRIRGATAASFYLDELTLLPWGFVEQARARMRVEGARAYATTNPDGPFHPVKVELLDRAADLGADRFRHFTWPIDDNPFLPPSYVDNLRIEYPAGSLWHKRFIEGLWVVAEGAVYDGFIAGRHVLTAEPEGKPDHLDVAIDYGTANPTVACLFASYAQPGEDGLITYLRRTYYHSGRDAGRSQTDAEYVSAIVSWLGDDMSQIRQFIIDPSAASFKAELRNRLARLGLARAPIIRDAQHEVLDGIRTQARMLASGAYRIGPDPSNAPVIREYSAYLWDAQAQARGEDRPIKAHDHGKDAERYYLHTLFRSQLNPSASRAAAGALARL